MKRFLIAVALFSTLLSGSFIQAGARGGPQFGVAEIAPAFGARQYRVVFRGGEIGRVALNGDHDTDLDLYIYDSAGRCVAVDDDHTDVCLVSWFASATQEYTIRVVNRGSVYNEFDLVTN